MTPSRSIPRPKHFLSKIDPVFLTALLFFAVGFLIYSNSFHAPFQFDDYVFIVDRMDIRNIHRIWNGGDLFRKIPYLSFALNYRWTGLNVWSWHLVNLLLHITLSLTIYGISMIIWNSKPMAKNPLRSQSRWLSIAAGLVFLCHPLATSAVTYVYQRIIVFAALFHALTLWAYLKARVEKKPWFFAPAVVFMLLACFSKQVNSTLPLTLLLTEISFCSADPFKKFTRWHLFAGVAFAGLACLFLWYFHIDIFHFSPDKLRALYPANINSQLTWKEWIPTQMNVMRTYLRLFVFPINQMLDYDYPIASSFREGGVLLSVGLLGGLLALACVLWRSHRLVSFGIFFIASTLCIEFLAIRDTIFEHRAYLAMTGFALLLPSALGGFVLDARRMKTLLITVLAAFSIATFARNAVWANEELFLKDNVRLAPNKGRPYYLLGAYYGLHGQHEKAVPMYKRALEIWPGFADAWSNLGKSLEETGHRQEAIDYYRKAVEIDPQNPAGLNNYGSALVRQGRYEEARAAYREAIKRKPDNYETLNNMGSVYATEKKFDEAYEWYKRSAQANPMYADVHNNLGSILSMRHDYPAAEKEYKEAIRLDPARFEPHNNLAILYVWQERYEDALREYQEALKIQPDFWEANNNVATMLGSLGKYDDAEKYFRRAMTLNPTSADVIVNLANIYSRQKKFKFSAEILRQALRLKPGDPAILKNLESVEKNLKNNTQGVR